MGFQKILVALDSLAQSNQVFQKALDIAKKDKSQLMLFHAINAEVEAVTDLYLYGNYQVLQQKMLDEEKSNIRAWLQTYCLEATDQNIATEFDCKVGHPGFLICELARTWNADLIVVGRRGHTGLAEIFLGSVSNYVLHHAGCSILVVQPISTLNPTSETQMQMSL